MSDCWVSPQGRFWYCKLSHALEAVKICEEVYSWMEILNPEAFLEERGWMKYKVGHGWLIRPTKRATRKQINAIFEETGDDISGMG